jgi:hypothetical protein
LPSLGRRRFTRRRAPKRSRPTAIANSEPVVLEHDYGLLGHGVAEFPIATARPREPRAQLIALVGALQRWLVARWQWLRPRSLPCAVAGAGMLAVLAFSDYLAHYNEGKTLGRSAAPAHIELAPR